MKIFLKIIKANELGQKCGIHFFLLYRNMFTVFLLHLVCIDDYVNVLFPITVRYRKLANKVLFGLKCIFLLYALILYLFFILFQIKLLKIDSTYQKPFYAPLMMKCVKYIYFTVIQRIYF